MLLAARRWGWVLALALMLLARQALACKCYDERPSELVRPQWPSTSGLQLRSESIELDCSGGDPCRWRSTHVYVRSSPGEPAAVSFVFPFSYRELQIRFGGQVVEEDREASQRARDEARQFGDWISGSYYRLEDDGTRTTVELTIEGLIFPNGGPSLDPEWYGRECCHYDALELRHPFVPTYSSHRRIAWAPAAPDAETHIDVQPLPKHQLRVDAGTGMSMLRPRRLKGGPFLAVGGALLDANPARGRIGWEHTHPFPFLFYSAALETDFQTELTAVPAIEISHGRGSVMWFIPCAGLGLGVPVQILPDPRPGLRGQFSLSWRVFSILTTFDWHMPLRSTDEGVERPTLLKLAILGQFSF